MSEEILKALMEMFALIVKQDGGMLQSEKDYVSDFLSKQLPHENADEYFKLFLENAGPVQEKEEKAQNVTPSVRDSVKILNICKTINRTLTQEQKVIVLVRVFELIDSDRQYTPQRMNIVTTIGEVFRISPEEFNIIKLFVSGEGRDDFHDQSMISIDVGGRNEREANWSAFAVFLKVPSVGLYFFRCFGEWQPMLNGLPVRIRRVYTFASGSSLTAPPAVTIFYGDITSRFASGKGIPRLSFVAEKVNYTFPDGVNAVTDVTFSASEGQMLGIMGTSGTGKTTLLNMLSGLLKPTSGDIRINGTSMMASGRSPEGVIGFVPQDDMLIEDLTVFENLYCAASLCFAEKKREEITLTVKQMLQNLGLINKKDMRVGTPLNKIISGGERKRLNIALELIREPSILFLDEPTSGLSSRDSQNVIDLMHELTLRGKLIITVVHQPSSEIFKSFDKVLILDHEGIMVYFGNPLEAVVHFRTLDSQINSNIGECPSCGTVYPDTIFNILEARVVDEYGRYTDRRKVTPSEWGELFHKKNPVIIPEEVSVPAHSNLHRPGWVRQVMIFLARDIKSKLSDRQYLLLICLEGPVLGLLLSYIIRYIANPSSSDYIFRENENIPIFIFMSVIVALFLGLTISAEEIFRDRKILKREHFLHLSRSSYLIAKVLIMISISALQSFLFLIIANSVLEVRGLFFSYWIALFVTALCANMLGLNISSAFSSAISIYIVIPLLMIPMMVLSGAMFPFDKLNRKIGSVDKVPLIAEFMPTRWSYEALMVRQFKGNEYDKRVYHLKQQISVADFNTIYRIPRVREEAEAMCEHVRWEGRLAPSNDRLPLISNEVSTIAMGGVIYPFPGRDSLNARNFSLSLGRRLLKWLDEAEKSYLTISNSADKKLDDYVQQNKDALQELYDSYHNDKLEEIVKKIYEKNKILEYRNHLIQNVDLIYLEPHSRGIFEFRTHFMAPVKTILGLKTDTFVFNILLMVFSAVILYILLYFEVLKKIIKAIEGPRFQKRARNIL